MPEIDDRIVDLVTDLRMLAGAIRAAESRGASDVEIDEKLDLMDEKHNALSALLREVRDQKPVSTEVIIEIGQTQYRLTVLDRHILYVTDEERGVSPKYDGVTVASAIDSLIECGLVGESEIPPHPIRLTPSGRQVVAALRARNR